MTTKCTFAIACNWLLWFCGGVFSLLGTIQLIHFCLICVYKRLHEMNFFFSRHPSKDTHRPFLCPFLQKCNASCRNLRSHYCSMELGISPFYTMDQPHPCLPCPGPRANKAKNQMASLGKVRGEDAAAGGGVSVRPGTGLRH